MKRKPRHEPHDFSDFSSPLCKKCGLHLEEWVRKHPPCKPPRDIEEEGGHE